MDHPRGGVHYPRSVGELQAWFRTDGDCLDYLEWLRWPAGFVCPECGRGGGWRLGDGRIMCSGCGDRTSVTAGTIFDRTRTPLTVWFHVIWLFATAKDGSLPSACSGPWRSVPTRPRGPCCTGCARSWWARGETGWPGRWRWTRPTSAVRSRGCGAAGPGGRRS